ncbi:BRO-N domain-containing protein [Paenibacillus lautus]|uniref:BRO-N domain-containing protein n=1 Tax=Paenibacillus lautus TaxID=1401 RepID=UPI003D265056
MTIGGEPWFVAKDVCDALGINQAIRAVERLDSDEVNSTHVIDSLGRGQKMYIVNEPGLYSLILGSRKPEARAFKRWITHEVIPSIRRNGMYATDTTQKCA